MNDTYKSLLLDPRWQKKKSEVQIRFDWTCQDCGSKEKTLHVHHKYYISKRKPWEYDDDCFNLLCEDCHTTTHLEKKALEEAIRTLSSTHYLKVAGFIRGLSSKEVSTFDSFDDAIGYLKAKKHIPMEDVYAEIYKNRAKID